MITKIGLMSKETFDRKRKIDKNSKLQDALGGLAAVGLLDGANNIVADRPTQFLLDKAVEASPEIAQAKATGAIDVAMDKGVNDLGKNPNFLSKLVKNPVTGKLFEIQHLKYMPAISALSTYKGTRERDRDPNDNNSKRWYAGSVVSLAPAIAQTALVDSAQHNAARFALDEGAHAYMKSPWIRAANVTANLLPYILANAAGYGVAKFQDKTIDAYNNFKDKQYTTSRAILGARKKAKETKKAKNDN